MVGGWRGMAGSSDCWLPPTVSECTCIGTAVGFSPRSTEPRLLTDTGFTTSEPQTGAKCTQEAASARFFSSMVPSLRHNAAMVRQSSGSAVDLAVWHLVFFDLLGRTCNVTPAVFGFQAAVPTAQGARVLRNVQGVWLLWLSERPGSDGEVLPDYGQLWLLWICQLCELRPGAALSGRHARTKVAWLSPTRLHHVPGVCPDSKITDLNKQGAIRMCGSDSTLI